jgi:hypothetical protein
MSGIQKEWEVMLNRLLVERKILKGIKPLPLLVPSIRYPTTVKLPAHPARTGQAGRGTLRSREKHSNDSNFWRARISYCSLVHFSRYLRSLVLERWTSSVDHL